LVASTRTASYDEVIQCWLNWEYDTRHEFRQAIDQRFGARVKELREGKTSAPVQDRRSIMEAWRGGVLQGLDQAKWLLSKYGDADLSSMRLIDSGDWREITKGSLTPEDAARAIESDIALRNGPYSRQVSFILNRLATLATKPSKIIFVGVERGPYVVVDGVHRIIAACLYYKVRNGVALPEREGYLGILLTPYAKRFA
jgi:hypothetical protein